MELDIVPIEYDVILGKPWLATYNPDINWKTNVVQFDFYGKEIEWRATSHVHTNIQTISVLQLKKLLRKNKCIAHLVLIKKLEKSQENESVSSDKLKKLLDEYKDVFPDK